MWSLFFLFFVSGSGLECSVNILEGVAVGSGNGLHMLQFSALVKHITDHFLSL
jgi:hypothetical protein